MTASTSTSGRTAESRSTGAGPLGERSPGRPRPSDSLAVLLVFLVLLVCVPSVYVISPLGSVGTPAAVVGVGALGLWVLRRVVGMPTAHPTPVHRLLLVFVLAVAASVVAGTLRPTSGEEYTALWRGALAVASWSGIALTVMDGLRTRERLELFLRYVVWAGVGLAVVGVFQFVTGVDVVPLLHPPGLTANTESAGTYVRSGFSRVNGTALHAIEFGAVLTMILPIAFARALRGGPHPVRRWLPVLLIGGVLPLTVARSGMLGLAVVLVFAFVMMRRQQRLRFLLLLPFLAIGFRALVPGLLGTILSLFTSAGEDISISGRTSDYSALADFFSRDPLLGRGVFTFIPGTYRILDNQYLGTLVEGGVVGLLALVALIAGAAGCTLHLARSIRSGAPTDAPAGDHLLPMGIGASLTGALLLFGTFDAFSFPMCMGVFSIVLGASGALWRLHRPPRADAPPGRRPVAVVAGAVATILAVGAVSVQLAGPRYDAQITFAVAVLPKPGENVYDDRPGTSGVTDVLRYSLDSEEVRARLTAAGAGDYTIAIGDGSLGLNTDVLGYGDVMHVRGSAGDPATARRTTDLVVQEIRTELAAFQDDPGIDPATVVAVLDADPVTVYEVRPHRAASVLATVALAALTGLALRGRRTDGPGPTTGSSPLAGSTR